MSMDSKTLQPTENNNSVKVTQAPLELNHIRVTSLVPEVAFLLGAQMYDIESSNTLEARVQASTITTPAVGVAQVTNVFQVQKIAAESLVETAIPSGQLLLGTVVANDVNTQQVIDQVFVNIRLKPAEL